MYQKIKDLLRENRISYKEYRHKPVLTSWEAAKVRGTNISAGAKAMIFIADRKPIMVVVPGDKKVNTKALKHNLHIKDLKFAPQEAAEKTSGVKIGGIPPFGSLFNPPIPVYTTKNLLKNDIIDFNAGDRSISIEMKAKDWKNLVRPETGDYDI